jgi:predicted amidohydrolase YtcJ
LTAWPELLGEERYQRAFAYREFADAGALMAIGTDSPTSPWSPMHNFHVAINRQSSKDPTNSKIVHEHFRLGMCETFVAATQGAARSVFAENRVGSLSVGKLADFIVVDMEWDPKTLLKAEVKETWFGGARVF